MKRKNILYIAETASGGSAFSLYNLVREINKNHANPTVLFIKENNPYVVNKIKDQGIAVLSFDKKQLGGSQAHQKKRYFKKEERSTLGDRIEKDLGKKLADTYFSVKSFYLFIRYQAALILPIFNILRDRRIDIVHLNNGLENGQCAILAAKFAGVPVICHNRMFSKWTGFEKLFIRFVDKFISISRAVFNHSVGYGVPPEKGVVIHNALDLSDFSDSYDGSEIKKEFGWDKGVHIIAVVGRIVRWKGQEYFLKAMAKICRNEQSARGLIIGEQSYYKGGSEFYRHLVSMSEQLGLENKIVFTGFRDDIPRLISAVDVLVHSSIEPEPFGRVVIEGMASGKPVVATSAGGVLEIIENNVTGLLIPCKDVEAMVRAIGKVLSDRELAKNIGLAARQSVENRFMIQHHAAEVQRVYDSV